MTFWFQYVISNNAHIYAVLLTRQFHLYRLVATGSMFKTIVYTLAISLPECPYYKGPRCGHHCACRCLNTKWYEAIIRNNNDWKGLCLISVNSLWPGDAIWQHRSVSMLAQVMACCLTATSWYLNYGWLIISKFQWHSSDSKLTIDASAINHLKLSLKLLTKKHSDLPKNNQLTNNP